MKEKITIRRKELNMTLEEVGEKVGVGKSTVRKWETGDIANMKRDKIALLAEALKVSPAYLMGWEDIEQNEIRPLPHPGDNIGRLLGKIYIQCDSDECTEDFFETYLDLNPDQRATVRRVTYSLAGRSEPVAAEKK